MTQFFLAPARVTDTHALPDGETFQIATIDDAKNFEVQSGIENVDDYRDLIGWYWRACLPGSSPDGEPNGPFKTDREAIKDAQQQ